MGWRRDSWGGRAREQEPNASDNLELGWGWRRFVHTVHAHHTTQILQPTSKGQASGQIGNVQSDVTPKHRYWKRMVQYVQYVHM